MGTAITVCVVGMLAATPSCFFLKDPDAKLIGRVGFYGNLTLLIGIISWHMLMR